MAGIQISGLASGLDTENIIKDLMKVERIRVDKVDKSKQLLEMKMGVWEEMNNKIYSFYTSQVFNLKSSGVYRARSTNVSDESILTASASSSAMRGVYSVKVNQLANAAHLYSKEIADADVTATADMSFTLSDGSKTATIELKEGDGISDFVSAIKNSGLEVNANFDSATGRIFMDSKVTGASTQIDFTDLDTPEETSFMESLGFFVNASGGVSESEAVFYESTVDGSYLDEAAYLALDPASQANYDPTAITLGVVGKDSAYTYNGVSLTASSNDISINGLSLKLNKVSAEEVTINVTQNTDEIYNKVKEFVSAYNELMTEINKKLGADDAGDYEPLTEEEKSALDADTIKLWETKIKDSLLRRDPILSGLATSMRNILTGSVGVDLSGLDSNYLHLSDLGIVTGDFSEKGKLHIEGDITDSFYGIKDDKLRTAIEEDPDKVADLLTAIGNEMHSMMNEKMKSTSLSSALTFYNDKSLKKEVNDYEDRINSLEDYLSRVQDRYYSQFNAMEQAIQRMNSQASYFTSMMSSGQS